MKNEFYINWTGTSGAINGFVCCGNGLHQPLTSGVTSGGSTLSAGANTTIYGLGNILSADSSSGGSGPYNFYRIISSKVFCNTQNISAATSDAGTLTVIPVDGNTLGNLGNVNGFTVTGFCELPYSKMKTVSGTTVNTGVNMSSAMSTARMYGLRYRASLEDTQYQATYNANPSAAWWWVFAWFPSTSNTTAATTLVRIEYWVEFFNRNNLALTSS